jgi:hypothetical protein
MISEKQYSAFMKTYKTRGVVSHAALKSSMHRSTAHRYLKAGLTPAERKRQRPKRVHRTQPDPVKRIWPDAVRMLQDSPEFEAKVLFEFLLAQLPPQESAPLRRSMRTFYRRVAEWKLEFGKEDKTAAIPQDRTPGQVMQFDWTNANELEITLGGVPFPHLLAHGVLPYSNCEWAIPCLSESTLSLKAGVQAAYWAFGGVTPDLQTDMSSTATHQLKRASEERGFNVEYLAFCKYLHVTPQTIHVRSPDENADVESLQGHLKRRLNQHLLLRRSRDFKDLAEYAAFVVGVCRAVNALPDRAARFAEERKRFRRLPAQPFPEYQEISAPVGRYGTVQIKKSGYSVPSRYMGCVVQAHVTESEVAIYHAQKLVAKHPRVHGQEHKIHYPHVLPSLLKKPGGFTACRYRDQLFPTVVYRQAHERLLAFDEPRANRHYLQLLQLAVDEGEDKVGEVIATCLREAVAPTPAKVRARLKKEPEPPPVLSPFVPQLGGYDRLLEVSA